MKGLRCLKLARIPLSLSAFVLLAGCSVQPGLATSGCASDSQCKDGRVCADRICSYPEDLARRNAAQHLGEVLLRALAQGEPRIFASTWPDAADYAWAFDFSPIAGDPLGEALIAKRTQSLTDDFGALLGGGGDWTQASFTRFEPGRSRPIVAGTEHAKRNLERLEDSRLYFKVPGVEEERMVTISSVLLLRGRWRLFRLTPPASSPDGDVDKR